ncbi:hypothetical protein COLO4_26083 [Corchorus olitorius]|uniref:Syringolide-induced protein 14-1-1 n=1 Tax=Corchorus olitorius TaxID=93759 RepID=A0A1R3HYN9_9ROSI|nr:hypothetical protein COLO4_26083 [Corchorus olitorius]
MENKQVKPKNTFLKFLPKAASAVSVSFQNPPFSPGRDAAKLKSHAARGFSGPIVSIIPDEARRKSKSETFETQEPTSPKVSCMGQIKHKKSIKKARRVSPPKDLKPVSGSSSSSSKEVKKHASKLRRIFSMGKPPRKSDATTKKAELSDRAPSLGQMKRFASGRDAFSSFDWTAQIAPVDGDNRDYYSDEERRDCDFEDEEVIIPFSAPMTVGGGELPLQPRKEINLWKRRTMNPPRPLQLNPMVTAN